MPVRALEGLARLLGKDSGHRGRIGKFLHHIDGEQPERQGVRVRLQLHSKQEKEGERTEMGNSDGDNGKIHHEELGIINSHVSRYGGWCTGDGRGHIEFDRKCVFKESNVDRKHHGGDGGVLTGLRGCEDVRGHVGIASHLHVKGGPNIASRMRSWPNTKVVA